MINEAKEVRVKVFVDLIFYNSTQVSVVVLDTERPPHKVYVLIKGLGLSCCPITGKNQEQIHVLVMGHSVWFIYSLINSESSGGLHPMPAFGQGLSQMKPFHIHGN